MPTCIYCRAITSGDEPPDHPVAQALGNSRYALSPGDVCTPCNSYIADLDHHVCNHHHLATMIVFAGIKGSKGRLRRTIHQDFSFDIRTQSMSITASKRLSVNRQPGHIAMNHPGSRFDEWKFSRGLHRMALGLAALAYSPETALLERFDEVRAYIRHPVNREVRPYYQRITDRKLGNRSLPRVFAEAKNQYYFAFDVEHQPSLVYMNLFVDEFGVALDGSLSTVSPNEVSYLASTAGIPDENLSRRPWGLLPFARGWVACQNY